MPQSTSIIVANGSTLNLGDKTLEAGFSPCWGNMVLYTPIFCFRIVVTLGITA